MAYRVWKGVLPKVLGASVNFCKISFQIRAAVLLEQVQLVTVNQKDSINQVQLVKLGKIRTPKILSMNTQDKVFGAWLVTILCYTSMQIAQFTIFPFHCLQHCTLAPNSPKTLSLYCWNRYSYIHKDSGMGLPPIFAHRMPKHISQLLVGQDQLVFFILVCFVT